MLEAVDICSWRNHDAVLEDLSFQVEDGQALWIRGANGSGKTTLIRILAGLRQPDSGSIHWRGESIYECRPEYASASLFIGHHDALKDELSVRQNLEFYGELRNRNFDPAMIQQSLDRIGMVQSTEQRTGTLSAGQRRRTALARLLLTPAKMWLLDEPMTALDVEGRERLETLMHEHTDSGGIIIFSSHQPLAHKFLNERVTTLELE